MSLRPHQQRLLEENPNYALLCWAPRTGKSLAGQNWINHPIRSGRTYVICIKKNKKEWQKRCPNSTVYTKEEFKKFFKEIKKPTAILVDEVHNFHGKLFIAKDRSELSLKLYTLVKENPSMHFMGLTGTPLSNDPSSIHTALTYIGEYTDWKVFRNKFYNLEYKPFLPRPAYFAIKDWREGANELLKQYADIVTLRDCVDSLPPEIIDVITIKTKPRIYAEDEDYHWTKDHRQEQTEKYKHIKTLGYRKLIIVCHYTDQINELYDKLKNDKPTYIVNSQTKDQEGTIAAAQKENDCYLIINASMGEGFDGYMFDAMVFASMPHRVLFHTQMKARLDTVEPEHMKPIIIQYIIGGKWDKIIYESIIAGEEFNCHKYE